MPQTDREALTEAAEPLNVDVPEYIYETPPDVHTDWIIGSALEDGREAGDTRHELQRRVAAYLAAARRLRSPSDRGGDDAPGGTCYCGHTHDQHEHVQHGACLMDSCPCRNFVRLRAASTDPHTEDGADE